jgi:alkylation response protein AidB-like acyl-CoA dehydrogenase
MRLHSMRQLTNVIKGRSSGVESLISKLAGTELSFELADAGMALGGSYATLERSGDSKHKRDRWVRHLMTSFAFRISGGSSHIQKNIIAERGLRMPKGR